MKEIDVQRLLEQANEVKVVAFLQEVIDFIREIKPVLENINYSIRENLQKMPTATKKLSKVTEATEYATTEILNLVDGIYNRTGQFKKEFADLFEERRNVISRTIEFLKKVYDDTTSSYSAEAGQMLAAIKEGNINIFAEKLDDATNFFFDNLNAITMALQVQDITAQQIAAVNSLLETVSSRLSSILLKFKTKEIIELLGEEEKSKDNVTMLHRQIAFDPEAVNALMTKEDRQGQVDLLMQKHIDGTLTDADLQDTISTDALFAGNSMKDIPAQSDDVSQDDIDALFAGNAADAGEEISQDDIDALFS